MGSKILAGRYELIEKIGDGGMAVVYKAKDRLLNRFVAIKILKPEFIKDPKFIDSFRRESQAAAGLSHPNIVSVFDVGEEGNIYYIVMEVLEGDTLSDIIRREGHLSEMRAIDIAKQIAQALSSAHKKNIIHRDVKPHNILMSEDGTAKDRRFRNRESGEQRYDREQYEHCDGLGSLSLARAGERRLCGRAIGYLFAWNCAV